MSLPDEVPRDPEHYRLSGHAFVHSKQRGIERELIGETIEDGAVQAAKGSQVNVRFLHDPPGVEESIGVVADVANGEIATVFWNHEYDHPELASPGRDR